MKSNIKNLDIKETLLSNIPWGLFVSLVIVFLKNSFIVLNTFDSDKLRLMGLIIFMFTMIKLLYWTGQPKIVYNTKKGKLVLY